MNYLELYRSAYITYICLYHQKFLGMTNKEAGWDAIYSFIDLSTSPYHLGIAYKEGDL